MSKVVVIGAGASGIVASILASKNNEVILIDGNKTIGKKILITGNGKCNYWNNDIDIKNYHTDSINNLKEILDNKDKVLSFLNNLGIYPKIKNGYYYPNSNQASSVVEIFNRKVKESNIKTLYEVKVTDIEKVNNKFIIKSNIEDIICDKVIISSGSMAYPKTGSDGSLYKVLEKYHTINKVSPSLVPLVSDFKYLKDWNNIRVDAKVDLIINNNKVDSEIGEIQLTEYGVSGIPIFNLSGLVSKNLDKNIKLRINFLNDINNLYEFIDNRNIILNNPTIENLFESILPYQLIFTLLKYSKINKDNKWNNLSNSEKELLINNISNLELNITNTLSYDRGQVCTGGVSLNEINSKTMESLKVKDLYITGEILDVDGKCGGFNLGFAFISGYLAGCDLSD